MSKLIPLFLLTACTVSAPIEITIPDPRGKPADMSVLPDLAPLTCGNAGTVCDPGQICWHNNCLDPSQIPDAD